MSSDEERRKKRLTWNGLKEVVLITDGTEEDLEEGEDDSEE